MSDWITTFLEETENVSPEPFRLWAAIGAIAGVLERRVYCYTDKGILYPNLYLLLTGGSGSGKSLMVNEVRSLWKHVKGLHVGPDNPTKSALLLALMNAKRTIINGTGSPSIFSAMAIGCREFGVLISKHDHAFLSDMTDIFDNPDIYEAPRTSVESYRVENPTLNILSGVTSAFLYDIFPDVAWAQGFTSRLVFIYSEPLPKQRGMFAKRPHNNKQKLGADLATIFNDFIGEFSWTPAAAEAAEQWCRIEGMPPVPDHGRLKTYSERRESLLIKLAMISAVSAGHFLKVEFSDFSRAKKWILDAERLMPDVFNAMTVKSDAQLISDLHRHCWDLYANIERNKRRPLQEEILWDFLQDRTTSERIPRIIESALRSGALAKGTYPGEYVPRTLDKFDLSAL